LTNVGTTFCGQHRLFEIPVPQQPELRNRVTLGALSRAAREPAFESPLRSRPLLLGPLAQDIAVSTMRPGVLVARLPAAAASGPQHLQALYARLGRDGGVGGQPLSPRTIKHAHGLLSRALGHAQTWGKVTQ